MRSSNIGRVLSRSCWWRSGLSTPCCGFLSFYRRNRYHNPPSQLFDARLTQHRRHWHYGVTLLLASDGTRSISAVAARGAAEQKGFMSSSQIFETQVTTAKVTLAMAIRAAAMSSKQNLQLVSALAETLERSRQNRSETLSAISALRSHVAAVSACHKSNASDQIPPHQTNQSSSERQPSENYNDLLISKYRERCSQMQEELHDTKARLSATESHVQHLEEQICQLKGLLDAAYQELYGQPAPTLTLEADHLTAAIDLHPTIAADAVDSRPQQQLRSVLLQPCLTNSRPLGAQYQTSIGKSASQ